MVARRPELWLLDEPHAGIDADGRDIMDSLMREAASVGATVMFASHELDRAGDVADRTVEISGGVITDDEVERPTAPTVGQDLPSRPVEVGSHDA